MLFDIFPAALLSITFNSPVLTTIVAFSSSFAFIVWLFKSIVTFLSIIIFVSLSISFIICITKLVSCPVFTFSIASDKYSYSVPVKLSYPSGASIIFATIGIGSNVTIICLFSVTFFIVSNVTTFVFLSSVYDVNFSPFIVISLTLFPASGVIVIVFLESSPYLTVSSTFEMLPPLFASPVISNVFTL